MDSTTPPPVSTVSSAAPPVASATEDKTVAIVSYLTLLGFIAALVIHSNKKTSLGSFHLRQTLGFFLTVIAFAIGQFVLWIIPILGWLAAIAIWVSIFVLWVMGLMAAIRGEMKPMPFIGAMYQKWFGNTFN
jgi:uncharacterized membrane protein